MLVGVGVSAYEHLQPLPRSTDDVKAVAEHFESAGFCVVTTCDTSRNDIVDALYEALPKDGLARSDTVLVLYWTGHAAADRDTGSVRLLAASNLPDDPDERVVTADGLAQLAARPGAGELLLLLDTCKSGQPLVDMARVVDAIQRKRIDAGQRWVGIVASCQDYERAIDGAMAKKLLDLLQNGPVDRHTRMRWSIHRAGIRGDDLIAALQEE